VITAAPSRAWILTLLFLAEWLQLWSKPFTRLCTTTDDPYDLSFSPLFAIICTICISHVPISFFPHFSCCSVPLRRSYSRPCHGVIFPCRLFFNFAAWRRALEEVCSFYPRFPPELKLRCCPCKPSFSSYPSLKISSVN
jgi:hypothetical protein